MKSIFINPKPYREEMELIRQDLRGLGCPDPDFVYAVLVLMLANRYIWENEAIARRSGKGGRLRATHSINGVRNRAKNVISKMMGERIDQKIDCLAADLPPDMGNWNVFEDER